MVKATGLYCQPCGSRLFVGQQYYAFQKNYIDVTCTKCAHSIDVEVRKLNKILDYLGFKTIKERHDLSETNNK
jgi:hypothetical protein